MESTLCKRPVSLDQYVRWLLESFGERIGPRTKTYYEVVVKEVRDRFLASELWQTVTQELSNYDRTFFLRTGYDLLQTPIIPDLKTKPFESYLLKTFRKNVLENDSYPEPPDGEWILPSSGFERIHDLVRTRFVVKYLDGVEELMGHLGSICTQCQHVMTPDYEARDEGYYAAHAGVQFPCHVPGRDFDTVPIAATIEIQITTQVQHLISRLLHNHYESRRAEPASPGKCWQWDYTSDEFAANYLGHILHYVEGMIMDIRRRQEGE